MCVTYILIILDYLLKIYSQNGIYGTKGINVLKTFECISKLSPGKSVIRHCLTSRIGELEGKPDLVKSGPLRGSRLEQEPGDSFLRGGWRDWRYLAQRRLKCWQRLHAWLPSDVRWTVERKRDGLSWSPEAEVGQWAEPRCVESCPLVWATPGCDGQG